MESFEIYNIVKSKIKEHIKKIYNLDKEMLIISNAYPGVWLEHVYDSIIYGNLFDDYSIAKNTIENFISFQKEDGQLPYAIKEKEGPVYYQIQECVSFVSLAYKVYEHILDNDFLFLIYNASKKWIDFYYKYKMTRNLGLVEMFVGYDTGHDNSIRLDCLDYPKNYIIDSIKQNAKVIPNTNNSRVLAIDMNCVLYNSLISFTKMAKILDLEDDYIKYNNLAKSLKNNIFTYLYDLNDKCFYDLKLDNTFNKVKSVAIFHLFQEHVLDINTDKDMINHLINDYLLNESEFKSNYPIPSVSLSEKNRDKYKMDNSWSYYSQALTSLRASLWMDDYNLSDYYDELLDKWIIGLTNNFKNFPMSQELDPINGIASSASIFYSSSMLLYLYAYKRLKK